MRRALFILALPFVLFGCQAAEVAPPLRVTRPSAAVPPAGEPKSLTPTDIELVHRTAAVTVGMTAEEALKVFQDIHESGFETDQLPPGFAEPYRARSWEDGNRGFGMILYRDRVAAAMFQDEDESLKEMQDLVQAHKDHLTSATEQTIPGKRVHYWFWEKDGQRLMICGFETKPEHVKVTACMGDDVVLDALGINFDKASRDGVLINGSQFATENAPPGSPK